MSHYEHIGKKLKIMIKESGKSQAEVACQMKQSQQQISYMLQKDDLPVYFVKEVCSVVKKPFYRIVLSDAELAEIKRIDPNLQELFEELYDIGTMKDAIDMLKAVVRQFKSKK
jgi:hypothetical protein